MADIDVKRGQQSRETGARQGQQEGTGQQMSRWGRGGLASESFWGWPGLSRPMDPWSVSPFELMRRMTEDMDRMFQGMTTGMTAGRPQAGFIPPVEIAESAGKLVVSAELPGLRPEDVRVEVNDAGLVIEGERKREHEETRGGVYRSERAYGAFRRVVPLPDDAQVDQADARFENGVLKVSVPVPEQAARRRQIPIKAGGEKGSASESKRS